MLDKPDMSTDVVSEEVVAANLAKKVATADDEDEADFLKLSHEITVLQVELDKVNERKKNIQLINDQVGGWTRRVGEKLVEQVDSSLRPEEAEEIFKSPRAKKLPLSVIF